PLAIASSRFTRSLRSISSIRWRAAARGGRAPPSSSSRRRSLSQSSQPRSKAKLSIAMPASRIARIRNVSPPAVIPPLLFVPQPIDLALEAAFLVDRDPLDHRLALLQLLHLVAERPDLGEQAIVTCPVLEAPAPHARDAN